MTAHLRRKAEDAQERFESGRKGLFRGDGTPKYSEPEMREREEELRRTRNEILREIEEKVKANQQEVELTKRLAAVKASGDRLGMFAYYVVAQRRAQEISCSSEHGAGDLELDNLVDELREALIGEDRRRTLDSKRQEIKDLEGVKTLTWSLQRGGRNVTDVYFREAYGNLPFEGQRAG